MKLLVEESDLAKVMNILVRNVGFHTYRDKMNAELHMSREVRYSPLTSETQCEVDRLNSIMSDGLRLRNV